MNACTWVRISSCCWFGLQIWVYDTSIQLVEADGRWNQDFDLIRDWYYGGKEKQLICDARILSSIWQGRHTDPATTQVSECF